nr:putative ankyrin repeat-containing domain-containing protein [Tanacetum cinerariifolium]
GDDLVIGNTACDKEMIDKCTCDFRSRTPGKTSRRSWLPTVLIVDTSILGRRESDKKNRGFSITAAVREDHPEIFEMLLKDIASQAACEKALLEASFHGR